MPNHRLPKSAIFGWLPQPCPRSGPRKRWKDVIHKDLKVMEADENEWYDEPTTYRVVWRATCMVGLDSHADMQTPA